MTPVDVVQLVAAPVTTIAGAVFGCIKIELGHLCHHARNLQRLSESMRDLNRRRIGYQMAVERAEAGMEMILPEVTDWLEDAGSEIEDHERRRSRAAGANCCVVHFMKWSESRRAVAKIKEVDKLLQRGNFATVTASFRPPPDVEEMRSADYVSGLPSVEAAIKNVMDALGDENVRSIGIYGLPGVGKTSLVQAVINRLGVYGRLLFSKVIVTTLGSCEGSGDDDERRVQDEIGDRLGLKLGSASTSMMVRANILRERMEKERRVLLVLDNVPKAFDPGELGIPDIPLKCQIIVTTWNHDVCRQMALDRVIDLRRLDKDESWTLFRRVVGDVLDCDGQIGDIGKRVLRYCGGLPLAIVSLGRCMRGESTAAVWTNLLNSFMNSVLPGEEMQLTIKSLQFIFYRLKDELIKECFLFCRTFPREHEILVSDLRAYGVGLGFLKVWDQDDLETAQNRLFTFIRKLTSACLLDYGNDLDLLKVKLPGVLREMALSVIVAQYGNSYFYGLPGKSITTWPHANLGSDCDYSIISLMHNSIQVLPSTFHCPRLECLLLQNNPKLCAIPDDFFQDARCLRVLDLSNTSLCSLPKTFTCLSSNLRTLLLNDCGQLSDVSLIGELLKLEILCLRRTKISQLPANMKNLTKLKLLDLSDTKNLKLVPPGVLSALISLEELYMNNSFSRWHETYGVLKEGDLPKSLFAEVASLPQLVVLEALVEKVHGLSEKHRGFLNVVEQSNVKNTSSRVSVSIMGARPRPMINVQSETLNFSSLKRLKVSSCPALISLFSPTVANMLKLLEELEVEGCEGMEQIIQDIASEEALCLETLPRLMTLKLHQLPSLGSFYRPGIHLLLPWLKTISVVNCPSLTSLPLGIGSAVYLKSVEGSKKWFEEMKWADSSLKVRLQPLFLEK